MEFLLFQSPLTAMAFIFASLLFIYFFGLKGSNNKRRVAPEAGGGWPLIGHLHLLGGPKLPHEVLGAMADKYGPIFTIRVGLHRALVVSSSEIAKECFTTNDRTFSTRPKSTAMEHFGYNNAMFGFSPYGPYWRELRKISVVELLSNHRLAMLNDVRESEVKRSIEELHKLWVKNRSSSDKLHVDMKKWFGDMTFNLVLRIIAGKQYSDNGQERPVAMRKMFELLGVFTVGDAIPLLRWLDLGGYEKEMKKTAKELDGMLQEWLEEHKQRRRRVNSGVDKSDQDFMDVLLSILDGATRNDEHYSDFDVDTINKATCLSLTLGATDTTTVTLTWAVSLLLNNSHALKKAQDELDIHVGRGRRVKESDIQNLVYLQAIVKETLRLCPATLLSPPRVATEDSNVGGYHVPAGTQLFVNLWKLHRDPRVWSDPLEFRPERFLEAHKDVDVRGQHFELIPFGSGRRACPGISFGLQVVHFVLASFLQTFEISTPDDKPVDMAASFGITNIKETPLEVLLATRIPLETCG